MKRRVVMPILEVRSSIDDALPMKRVPLISLLIELDADKEMEKDAIVRLAIMLLGGERVEVGDTRLEVVDYEESLITPYAESIDLAAAGYDQ